MPAVETVIAERPPQDGRDWHAQCARCGSSTGFVDCDDCGGEGWLSREEEDPLWYDPDDLFPCNTCRGHGGWRHCLSQQDWCKANPNEGREQIERGAIEWYTHEEKKTA